MTAVAPRAEVPVAPSAPGLGKLVATELLKLRTTRVWWGLLLTGILLAFLNSGLLAATAGLSDTVSIDSDSWRRCPRNRANKGLELRAGMADLTTSRETPRSR